MADVTFTGGSVVDMPRVMRTDPTCVHCDQTRRNQGTSDRAQAMTVPDQTILAILKAAERWEDGPGTDCTCDGETGEEPSDCIYRATPEEKLARKLEYIRSHVWEHV